ncbi:hypothetical protein [Roseospirillum parvum]|uniref:Uncharacterized protein n=1 Tax=Roseospirillum parvum TaxID=83401 RepID=A0A1G8EYC4_9PROT|nr:hypothetical protein [Roseospirillum parvum]SDH74875.1 hypothetical protein SAMN05421742_11179 [Roseospirillum parvum]
MSDAPASWLAHVRLAMLIVLAGVPAAAVRRRDLLRGLHGLPGDMASLSLLAELITAPRAQVLGDLSWLADAGLVHLEPGPDGAPQGAALLTRGREVALGLADVAGIAPPMTAAAMSSALAGVSLALGPQDTETQRAWLIEAGLLGADWALTELGRAVALGRARVDGVRAPSRETAMKLAAATARLTLEG